MVAVFQKFRWLRKPETESPEHIAHTSTLAEYCGTFPIIRAHFKNRRNSAVTRSKVIHRLKLNNVYVSFCKLDEKRVHNKRILTSFSHLP